MTQENSDKKIKQFFQKLRQENEAQIPAFGRVWQSALARQKQQRRTMPALRLAVASAVLIVFIGAVLFYQSRQHKAKETISLTAWRSPTASLLRPPSASSMAISTLDPAPERAQEYTLSGWQSPTRALRKMLRKRSFNKI